MPGYLWFAVLPWLSALSVIDARQRRLPNALTLPGAAVVFVGAAISGHGATALAGGTALGCGYLAVHLISPAGMGAGDVKLAFGVGALTGVAGAHAWLLASFGAPLLTALCGLLSRRRALPHGPAMCLATALVLWL